jgi:hypothetical protein
VIGDVDAKVGEGVDETLHLSIVVIDTKVALNKAPNGGIDVEDASFADAEEVVIQCQPGVTSRVVALPRDVLQVRGDGALDPRLDDAIHLVPS